MSSLYREYDPATLARLQDVLRGMLDDFAALCGKHGIRWWTETGTTIGALREGGIIPWDDDIDLGMLRKDFDRFLVLAEKELGDRYYVLDANRFPAYPLPTARLCLRGTKFREETMRGIDAPFGIFLDLYAFDNLSDDPREARRQWRRAWFWGKLRILRAIRSPVLYFGGAKAALVRAACFVGHYVLAALFSERFLRDRAMHWARLCENRETKRVFFPFATVPFRNDIALDEIFPTRAVPFDGRTVQIARGADAFIRKEFGDYMVPPPPGKRHNHPPLELDFGPPSDGGGERPPPPADRSGGGGPETPMVSVLLPTHNAGAGIRRMLDCLAAQTFGDFEAVVMDDGFNPETLPALRAFAAEHPFLRIERVSGIGVSEKRNRMLRLARGRFVAFVDDDDVIAPDYLDRFVSEALRTGADVVTGGFRRVSMDGTPLRVVRATDPGWSPLIIATAWAKLFRRDFLLEHGVEFLVYGLGEDIYFCFGAYAAAKSTTVLDYAGYDWIDNSASVSNTSQKRFSPDLDPVFLLDRLVAISGTGGLYRHFYVRYVVWYLLYAGRNSPPGEFVAQSKRLFGWLDRHGIPPRFPVSRRFRADGPVRFAAIVVFLALRRLGLVGAFARLYCRGGDGTRPSGGSRLVRWLLPPRRDNGVFRDTVWNAAMNVAAAALSVLVVVLVARLCGAYWCGVAGIALAMSQQLYTLGNFTIQGYQASDIAEKRSFGEYASAKSVSLLAMAAAAAAWVALDPPGRDKTLCLLPFLLFHASDAFGNVFFARYQQKGRLDAACRVRVAKIAAFMAVFAAMLAATRSAPLSLAAAALVHFALFFVLDRPLLRLFGPVGVIRPSREAFSILLACAPLAFNSFLVMAVNNVPRFAVDDGLGEEAVAAYGAVFMVSFTVSICADFIMNPQVVPLARAVRDGDPRAAWRTLRAPLAAIALLGAAGFAVGATFGIPLLAWVFGLDLGELRGTLCILLGGGVLVALYQLAQTVLVVLRKQGWGMVGMVLSTLCVLAAAGPAVAKAGLDGAAWTYSAATGLLFLCSTAFALFFGARAFRKPPVGSIVP